MQRSWGPFEAAIFPVFCSLRQQLAHLQKQSLVQYSGLAWSKESLKCVFWRLCLTPKREEQVGGISDLPLCKKSKNIFEEKQKQKQKHGDPARAAEFKVTLGFPLDCHVFLLIPVFDKTPLHGCTAPSTPRKPGSELDTRGRGNLVQCRRRSMDTTWFLHEVACI